MYSCKITRFARIPLSPAGFMKIIVRKRVYISVVYIRDQRPLDLPLQPRCYYLIFFGLYLSLAAAQHPVDWYLRIAPIIYLLLTFSNTYPFLSWSDSSDNFKLEMQTPYIPKEKLEGLFMRKRRGGCFYSIMMYVMSSLDHDYIFF